MQNEKSATCIKKGAQNIKTKKKTKQNKQQQQKKNSATRKNNATWKKYNLEIGQREKSAK